MIHVHADGCCKHAASQHLAASVPYSSRMDESVVLPNNIVVPVCTLSVSGQEYPWGFQVPTAQIEPSLISSHVIHQNN